MLQRGVREQYIIWTQLPIVESKAGSREIAARGNGSLPISIQFVYSFQIIVPVVQRKEQGFPKAKLIFCHRFVSDCLSYRIAG